MFEIFIEMQNTEQTLISYKNLAKLPYTTKNWRDWNLTNLANVTISPKFIPQMYTSIQTNIM